ncbi:MAG: DUF1778 domain-containing protein [Desulfobacteraceae bacterium]|nr:DUF1778 domain-containing protein [Desulfobacteraceae bacterium]
MPHVAPKNAPINIRARRPQRDLIDKAAAAVNKNRSDFMLDAACLEAENVLLDKRLFILDDNQFDAFEAAMQKPISASAAIQKLLASETPWEK